MYLAKIHIKNFRVIQDLEVTFNPTINILIGENGCGKSAIIDAIRLLYNIGKPLRDLSVSNEDFYEDTKTSEKTKSIEITYEFRDLDDLQKGAFYEFMVVGNSEEREFARVKLMYVFREGKYPLFSYCTGTAEGQRADYKAFELFQHYYLGALRDSTQDLLNTRNNILV